MSDNLYEAGFTFSKEKYRLKVGPAFGKAIYAKLVQKISIIPYIMIYVAIRDNTTRVLFDSIKFRQITQSFNQRGAVYGKQRG